jgi:hypothetical protein
MARKKRRTSTMRRLHRSFGAFATLFVLFMVLSGLVINHSNNLGLDQRHVSQPILLSWYGLGKPSSIHSYAVADSWLSFAGSQLYLNDRSVATITDGVGAVSNGKLLIAAGSDELLLLDDDGNLVERIPWSPISTAPIDAIGLLANTIVTVRSAGQIWVADEELLNWRQSQEASEHPLWSFSEPAPDDLQKIITHLYRGEGLSLERVLLDLHSGRIFGTFGVLVYDLLALALGFLSISGLVLWFRGRRNGKSK